VSDLSRTRDHALKQAGTGVVTVTRFKVRARVHIKCRTCGCWTDIYCPIDETEEYVLEWQDYDCDYTVSPVHAGISRPVRETIGTARTGAETPAGPDHLLDLGERG
jgi:hypothetical protein